MNYATGREAGSKEAYSVMVNDGATQPSNNIWTTTTTTTSLANQNMVIESYSGNPNVQHVWLRIPDGNYLGDGFSATNYTSLKKLYAGQIQSIQTLPISTSNALSSRYTLGGLRQAISEVVGYTKPAVVRTQDWLGEERSDHSDHYTTAKIVQDVVGNQGIDIVGYVNYACASWPANLDTGSENYTEKSAAFFSYAAHDRLECQSLTDCINKGVGEPFWLQRQYHVGDLH